MRTGVISLPKYIEVNIRAIHIGMRSLVGFLETYICNENSKFKVF
jgi:hypothetical protein